jgi:hypothetical protein
MKPLFSTLIGLVELAPDVKYRYANHAKLLAAINSIPKRQVFPALKYWPLDDLKKQFQVTELLFRVQHC